VDWKEYKYLGEWDNRGAVTFRPFITIYLRHGDVSIPIDALVDSGSDGMVVNADLATALNIDASLRRPGGLSGSTGLKEGFISDVSYEVAGFPDETISTSAIFMEGLPVPCLIGQRDFFDRFLVLFDKHNHLLKIAKPK